MRSHNTFFGTEINGLIWRRSKISQPTNTARMKRQQGRNRAEIANARIVFTKPIHAGIIPVFSFPRSRLASRFAELASLTELRLPVGIAESVAKPIPPMRADGGAWPI